jgi:hypothetical protein
MLRKGEQERGASALLIAMSLFLLLGFAAIAIDLSVGFNERRQDQTAADIGVMAGAIETLGTNITIRDLILDFTRRNVVADFSNADWQALWEGCDDPERLDLNGDGFNFQPIDPPAGWSTPTGKLECISFDGGGYVRVNLPDLPFETSFGRLFGVDTLQTQADAIATFGNRGGGGILPFALVSTAAEGQHACLRDSSGGLAEEPCDGPDAGNFGALQSPHYGTQPDGPPQNCTGSPKKDVVTVNIAYGIDHRIIPDDDGLVANEVRDTCGNIDLALTPDTMNTFTGLSNGVPEGLATGPVPGNLALPRLQQGGNPKVSVHTYQLDNRPLWDYIDPTLDVGTGAVIPDICERNTFDNSSQAPQDWDGDGTDDNPESWQHLGACLEAFIALPAVPTPTPLFLETLNESPRFGYVPQFWENSLGTGDEWLHVRRFKATWIQALWWKKNAVTIDVFHPGEGGPFPGGGYNMIQLSGIIVPDASLPSPLRGDPPPDGGLNPFEPELFR